MPLARRSLAVLAFAGSVPLATAGAQQASFVYRLGKDTLAVEQYTRTATRLTGDVVSRSGVAVVRTQYDATLGKDGKVTAATYRILGSDGKPIKGRPVEVRYAVAGDSTTRTVVWADSTQTRTLAAASAVPFAGPSYGMLEVAFGAMRRGSMSTGTFPVLGVGAALTLPTMAFTIAGGDTIRQANGVVYRVDREGRLQSYDASSTTAKWIATRGTGGLDIAGIASRMAPTGVLSSRGTARAAFQSLNASGQATPGGVVMIDYGRPLVRERTVWGGLLIPLDTIWRLGANDATHFATSREIAFGDVVVPPGLYTLFLYNAKGGPMLAISKQTGQWGTVYDQAKDLVRIPLALSATPEHVEEFTIAVRQAAPNRGALEFAWGNQVASASFVVH
ncbi:MAG: DUF2911 domain-containing protein [bacterium]